MVIDNFNIEGIASLGRGDGRGDVLWFIISKKRCAVHREEIKNGERFKVHG